MAQAGHTSTTRRALFVGAGAIAVTAALPTLTATDPEARAWLNAYYGAGGHVTDLDGALFFHRPLDPELFSPKWNYLRCRVNRLARLDRGMSV